MYFPSTNIEKFNIGGYKKTVDLGKKIMQWKRFIVWDTQQMDFIKQFCPNAEYQIVGVIDFIDSDKTIKDLITENVAKLGENISISRFERFQLGEKNNSQSDSDKS